MANPERYQLPFDFRRRPDPSQIYYELGFLGQEKTEPVGRFVRQLREEVLIRSPNDAAEHLLTNIFVPFESL